jgi:hypothetical protein
VISAGHAEHDSVRHLLESRYAAATVEVSEALRERVCRSIHNADVIEREVLAGFAAALDSYLRVAAHGQNSEARNGEYRVHPGYHLWSRPCICQSLV